MMRSTGRRFAIGVALAMSLGPVLWGQAGQSKQKKLADKSETFTGNVVPLRDLLEKFGAQLDPDAAPHWLALVTKDGKVYPLIRDEGAQMFYKDPSVRKRPMRLTGRLFADTHLLQVLSVNSIHKGQLHDIYYWCDICAIRRNAPGKCDCCGAPMELREQPIR
jgi:hypothetical protein